MRQFDWKRLESTQLLCLLSDTNVRFTFNCPRHLLY